MLDGSDSEWDGSSSDSSSSSSSDSDESEAEDQPKGRARWLKRVPVGGEKAKEEKKKTQQLGGAWHCVAWRRPFLPFFLGCRSTDRWSIHPHNERNRTCLPCPCLQRISHNFTPHPPPPPTTTADGEHVSRRKKKEAAAAAAAATQQRANLLYDDELTLPDFKKKVAEAVASRGRRSTGTAELLRQLQHLAYVGRRFGLAEEAPVAMHLILAMFETRRAIDEPMDVALWRQCAAYLLRLLALLEAEPRKVLRNAADGEDALVTALGRTSLVSEEGDGGAGGEADYADADMVQVPGSFGYFVTRLADEYTKSLQRINPHTGDYVARLKDEAVLLRLAKAVRAYYTRAAAKAKRCVACVRGRGVGVLWVGVRACVAWACCGVGRWCGCSRHGGVHTHTYTNTHRPPLGRPTLTHIYKHDHQPPPRSHETYMHTSIYTRPPNTRRPTLTRHT